VPAEHVTIIPNPGPPGADDRLIPTLPGFPFPHQSIRHRNPRGSDGDAHRHVSPRWRMHHTQVCGRGWPPHARRVLASLPSPPLLPQFGFGGPPLPLPLASTLLRPAAPSGSRSTETEVGQANTASSYCVNSSGWTWWGQIVYIHGFVCVLGF
jgi:hypothetical protein